jgi:phage gp36-like protein
MSYITNGDIDLRLGTARYIELTDDAGTGSANVAVADESRLGAEGEVDSYLGQRYAVPIDLAVHPEAAGVLKSVTLDLVEFRLHARRRDVPVSVIAKRDAGLTWLGRVARGETALPSAAPISPNPAAGLRSASRGDERTLSRDELSEF